MTNQTIENGQLLPVPWEFFDGEVTASAPDPWEVTWHYTDGLTLNRDGEQSVQFVRDPFPVATGCASGPAPVDAVALARSIQSDPDLVTTAPADVRIGELAGLMMDLTVAAGASYLVGSPAVALGTITDADTATVEFTLAAQTIGWAKLDLGRDASNGGRDRRDRRHGSVVVGAVAGQEHDGAAADRFRQLGPPDLTAPHSSQPSSAQPSAASWSATALESAVSGCAT